MPLVPLTPADMAALERLDRGPGGWVRRRGFGGEDDDDKDDDDDENVVAGAAAGGGRGGEGSGKASSSFSSSSSSLSSSGWFGGVRSSRLLALWRRLWRRLCGYRYARGGRLTMDVVGVFEETPPFPWHPVCRFLQTAAVVCWTVLPNKLDLAMPS